jgi:hypothetical protein
MGPRAGLDRCGKSRPQPGFDPLTVQLDLTESKSLPRGEAGGSKLLRNFGIHIWDTVKIPL